MSLWFYLVILALFGPAVNAEEQTYVFDIPQQSADGALTILADQTNISVVFDYEIISQYTANTLAGRYPIQQAVKLLLADTQLTYEFDSHRRLIVTRIKASDRITHMNSKKTVQNTRNRNLLAALISIFSAGGVTAQAQDTKASDGAKAIEEIIVTASKRGEQLLQDTAMSIDAVTGDTLSQMNATGIQDIARTISGLSVLDWGSNKKKLKIRGVSSAVFDEPQETVAVYLDDIPITGNGGTDNENGASPDIALFDLQRVEVLKGPQSTLYGASAMGGTVRYILNKPSTEAFEGKVGASLSNVTDGGRSWNTDLMLNFPVSDNVALRLVGHYRDIGGYVDNVLTSGFTDGPQTPPGKDVDSSEVQALTLSGLWQVNDNFSLLGRYLRQEYDVDALSTVNRSTAGLLGEGVPQILDPDDAQQYKYIQEFGKDDLDLFSLTAEWQTEQVTITSATSFMDRKVDDMSDESLALINFFGAPPGLIPAGLQNINESEQLVEELRIASNNEGPFNWVAGLYYYDLDKTYTQIDFAPGLDDWFAVIGIPPSMFFGRPFPDGVYYGVTDQQVEQIAVFGELTYVFNESWELTLGARWFEVDQERDRFASGIVNGGVSEETDVKNTEDGINPKISLAYRMNEDTLLYGTAAKGYRNGGVNQFVSPVACGPELNGVGYPVSQNPDGSLSGGAPTSFDSDSLWNYELGLKTTLAEGRVQFNGAVYHIDWDDIQSPISLACGFTFFDNIGAAEVNGAEISILAQLTDHLLLALNAGYTDSELAEDNAVLGLEAGLSTAGISDWMYSLSATYDFAIADMTSSLRLDYSYSSEADQSVFGPSDPTNRVINGFGIFNIDLNLDVNDRLNLSLFGKNLTDEREPVGASVGIFGDDWYLTRPRELGIKAVYQF